MKTKVKLRHDINQEPLFKDDIGYIDGYVQAADGRGYAVVVCGNVFGYAPINALQPMGFWTKKDL